MSTVYVRDPDYEWLRAWAEAERIRIQDMLERILTIYFRKVAAEREHGKERVDALLAARPTREDTPQ